MPETLKLHDAAPGVAVVAFNRPDVANALSTQMGLELLETWTALHDRADLRCVILTGEGRHFQAGADLKERNGMTDEAWAEQHKVFEAMARAQLSVPVPVIAAVNGAAMGGGCEMTLLSDFAYAADTARFGLPEVTLGIMPGLGGTQRLTRIIGKSKAMDLCLTGRTMDAAEAESCGLAARVVPADMLLDEALKAAHKIAAQSLPVAQMVKEAIGRAQETSLAEGLHFERRLFHAMFATADQKEGMAAFAEKRKPGFKDK